MKAIMSVCLFTSLSVLALAGCATTPKSAGDKMELDTKAQAAIKRAKETDPGL